ncbi:MAG: phosphomannomutase/phosphoglucomutase [Cycloclasticus sp.]|nr:phosphomannomutase/phosphoglucomutase [Cycloclasticus sp.]
MNDDGIEVVTQTDVPQSIFRAYDIRGIVDETLTEHGVFSIGRAIASEALSVGQQTIAIARDGRLHSPRLSESLSKGIQAAGCNVIDVGQVPTPVLYFSTHQLDTQSGVMITGSHNPANYNGLKIVIAGNTLSGDAIQNLYQRIQQDNLESGEGSYQEQMMLPEYIGAITGDVRLGRMMKVVVDCGNGVAGEAAPMLLSTLGCEVIPLYCDIDGNFPNHHPDPSKPENLQELIDKVREEEAELGLAFDGDGDRLGVVDSQGDVIWPDRQMMLYAMDVLSRQAGADIIYDVKCTRNLAKVIAKHGGKPIMSKTGHSLIKAKMKETNAELAGEMSGHIFFKERWFGFDDALYTAARLLEILTAEFRSTAEIFAELPDSVSTPELNISLKEGENFSFVEKLQSQAIFDEANIITIDGVRVEFKDGWGLVRASNTTPSLVLRFEADNEIALERIKEIFREQILKINADLELPF